MKTGEVKYEIEVLGFPKPIYDAPIEERLEDLKRAIAICESLISNKALLRPILTTERPGLKEGQFAIGNWIVSPRWGNRREKA